MKAMRLVRRVLGGLLLLTLLVLSLTMILPPANTLPRTDNFQDIPTAYPNQGGYPYPAPTTNPTLIALMHEADATQSYMPPTPTEPPVPTPLPTPVVTPIPLAEFPAIPDLPESSPEIFTLIYREGNVLHTIDSDGQNARVLVDIGTKLPLFLVSENFSLEKWGSASPDGKQLALVLSDMAEPAMEKGSARPKFDIYLYDLGSGDLRLLVEDGVEPVWSPDGTRIAYRSQQTFGLWIVDITTGLAKEIFTVDRKEMDYWVNYFTWSPDGQKIALVRTFSIAQVGEVWIIDLSNQEEPVNLVPQDVYAGSLNWSPVGDHILFLSHTGEHVTPERPVSLWIVDVTTHELTQVTHNMTISGGTPQWSSDGEWIVFTGTNLLEGGSYQYDLWLVSPKEKILQRLTADPIADLYPHWMTHRNIVFLRRGDGTWLMDLFGGESYKLFESNIEQVITINR